MEYSINGDEISQEYRKNERVKKKKNKYNRRKEREREKAKEFKSKNLVNFSPFPYHRLSSLPVITQTTSPFRFIYPFLPSSLPKSSPFPQTPLKIWIVETSSLQRGKAENSAENHL